MKMITLAEMKSRMSILGCMILAAACHEHNGAVRICTCWKTDPSLPDGGVAFDVCFDPAHPEQKDGYFIRPCPPKMQASAAAMIKLAKENNFPMDNTSGFTVMSGGSDCQCDRCKAERDSVSPPVESAINGILSLE